jgi:hypothetical protein
MANKDDLSWHFENSFYWYSDPYRLMKAIAQYELYKLIKNIPGEFLELGVYKGSSLIRFATFRETLETTNSRKIIGMDSFGFFPRPDSEILSDIDFIETFESEGGPGLAITDLERILSKKGFSNIELIKGDISSTLPELLQVNPQLRFAAVHFDLDVYPITKFALGLVWERVVHGGYLIFDDYGSIEGETVAVDNFIADRELEIRKFSFSKSPTYIIKR